MFIGEFMRKSQEDLNKIIKYAKMNGVKVVFKPRKKGFADMAWILFNTKTIVIFYKERESRVEWCMSILHELGHLINYGLNPKAYNEYFHASASEAPCKETRRIMYEREKADIALMPKIHKLLDLKSFSFKEICLQKDLDTWQFKFFLNKNRFPTHPEIYIQRINLKIKKYKLKLTKAEIRYSLKKGIIKSLKQLEY